jgi:hypothetical protein
MSLIPEPKITANAEFTPFKCTSIHNEWSLLIKPTTLNRYNPTQYHTGMFNEWTNEVCTEHIHQTLETLDEYYYLKVNDSEPVKVSFI